jgi:hypothetical protein
MNSDILDRVLISARALLAWNEKVIELATRLRVLQAGTEAAYEAKEGELIIWVVALVELPDKDNINALAMLQMKVPADEWEWRVKPCIN